MDAYYELIDLAPGNMVEDYDCEQDAIDALMRVLQEHGSRETGSFGLAHVQGSQRRLMAVQDDLILRVEKAMVAR
jgi:hypothetical protein